MPDMPITMRGISRRRLLRAAAAGAGSLAVSGFLGRQTRALAAVRRSTATPGGVADVAYLGDPTSERQHDVSTSGAVTREAGEVEAGQLTENYQARKIGPGGRLRVRLQVDRSQPLTLQLREVRPSSAWGTAYGFTVRLNGVVVYGRDPALPAAGAGPYTSLFLDTADPELVRGGSVVVTIEATGAGAVHVTELWAYHDLGGLVEEQGMRVPSRIVGVLGKDYQSDTDLNDAAAYLTSRLHTSDRVLLGASVLDYFPVRTPQQMAANYQRYLAISRANDLPITIESTSDWEGTPGGVPDGKGGTFGDIEYQQILWSPQDQTGPDKDVWKGKSLSDLLGAQYDPHFGLSVPNIWGNTPWLTWRHPDLNAFYTNKANQSIDQIRPLLWELQRTGESTRLLPFSTTMESTYWSAKDGVGVADGGYTDYNGGVARTDILADFNPATVAAAAADGVDLDPRNGLSAAAEHWLFKNQSYPQQMYADIFYQGLPRERIEVGSGTVRYPQDMLRHNIFCEIYSRKQAPYWSGAFASIAQGIVRHARPGSEYIELDNYSPGGFQHLVRMREFGRLADPNLEDSVSSDPADKTLLLRQLYVNGGRYATLYNWKENDVENYVNPYVDDMAPVDVNLDGPDPKAVAAMVVGQPFVAGPLRILDHIDVRMERVGAGPVALRLYDGPDSRTGARLLAMRQLSGAELPPSPGWVRFGVPVIETEAGHTYYLEVSQSTADGAFGLVPLTGAGGPSTVDGTVRPGEQLAVRTGLDMDFQRDRSLVLQWRRDAADAIGNVREELTGQDVVAATLLRSADTLLSTHRYVEAYRMAIKADSLRFPVLFQVAGKGALQPFPLTVDSAGTVDIDLQVVNQGAVQLTVRAYDPGSVTIRATDLGPFTSATLDGSAVPVSADAVTLALPDALPHELRLDA